MFVNFLAKKYKRKCWEKTFVVMYMIKINILYFLVPIHLVNYFQRSGSFRFNFAKRMVYAQTLLPSKVRQSFSIGKETT